MCWSIYNHISTISSPYLVKLVTFDIILLVLIFWGKLSAQLICGGKCPVYAQTIFDNNDEWMTKISLLNIEHSYTENAIS